MKIVVYLVGCLFSISSGFMIAGGVFTAIIVLGLAPRFVGRSHTGRKLLSYENCIVAGSIAGCVLSVTGKGIPERFINELSVNNGSYVNLIEAILYAALGIFGIFSGIFVGCLALALAEILDTYAVFERRIQLKKGLAMIVLWMALGKIIGSLIYFLCHLGIAAEQFHLGR